MNIFVGGVNGSGKTTILDLVRVLRPDWVVTKSSQAFMDWLGFPNDYVRLQQLDRDERDTKLAEFMRTIITRGRQTTLQLLDSHYLNLKRGRTEQVTGPWLKDFDALVLISTPASSIIDRLRGTDRFQDRALFPEDFQADQQSTLLQEYVHETEKEFSRLASMLKLPHIKIENSEKAHAADQLVQFIESLTPAPDQDAQDD